MPLSTTVLPEIDDLTEKLTDLKKSLSTIPEKGKILNEIATLESTLIAVNLVDILPCILAQFAQKIVEIVPLRTETEALRSQVFEMGYSLEGTLRRETNFLINLVRYAESTRIVSDAFFIELFPEIVRTKKNKRELMDILIWIERLGLHIKYERMEQGKLLSRIIGHSRQSGVLNSMDERDLQSFLGKTEERISVHHSTVVFNSDGPGFHT